MNLPVPPQPADQLAQTTQTTQTSSRSPSLQSQAGITDCWSRIGVRGDRSCERLAEHLHCRNCEVYPSAAGQVMQRELPPGFTSDWTAHYAKPLEATQALDCSALAFRIGQEWFALPTTSVMMVAEAAVPHRIPHRQRRELLGLANIRGTLYPCISLGAILDIDDESAGPDKDPPAGFSKTVILRMGAGGSGAAPRTGTGTATGATATVTAGRSHRYAMPVHDVLGIVRYHRGMLEPLPATARVASRDLFHGILGAGDKRIACMDGDRIASRFESALK
jgi:chemotaxis-related protein WspD